MPSISEYLVINDNLKSVLELIKENIRNNPNSKLMQKLQIDCRSPEFDLEDISFYMPYGYKIPRSDFVAYLWAIGIVHGINFLMGKQKISFGLFDGNDILKKIIIPNGVKKLENMAFENSINLESVKLPNSLEKLGEFEFRFCASLTTIDLHFTKITKIPYACFAESGLEEIIIPKTITTIDQDAFSQCTELKKVVFENINNIRFIHGGIFNRSYHGYSIGFKKVELCDPSGREIVVKDSTGKDHILTTDDIDYGYFNKGIFHY